MKLNKYKLLIYKRINSVNNNIYIHLYNNSNNKYGRKSYFLEIKKDRNGVYFAEMVPQVIRYGYIPRTFLFKHRNFQNKYKKYKILAGQIVFTDMININDLDKSIIKLYNEEYKKTGIKFKDELKLDHYLIIHEIIENGTFHGKKEKIFING